MASEDVQRIAELHSSFARLSVWYALMYVVIEGYREIAVPDAEIDRLLAREDYETALRRFRNATFHAQKEPFPDKLMEFLVLPEATDWARALNRAFEGFFRRVLPIDEILKQLRADAS